MYYNRISGIKVLFNDACLEMEIFIKCDTQIFLFLNSSNRACTIVYTKRILSACRFGANTHVLTLREI